MTERKFDMNKIMKTFAGLPRITLEMRAEQERISKLLQDATARRAALNPEQRAAEDKARQDKIDQEEWDNAVNTGIMVAKLRAAGFDIPTPDPFPQDEL